MLQYSNYFKEDLAFICRNLLLILYMLFSSPADAKTEWSWGTRIHSLLEMQILDQRVANIGWRLATKNVELCNNIVGATGINMHAASQYLEGWQIAANHAFLFVGNQPAVLAVAVGSPAWEAGIRANDTVVALNGKPLIYVRSLGTDANTYLEIDSAMKKIESVPVGEKIVLETIRDQKRKTITFYPVPSCASRFEMAPSNELNATANGDVVQVSGKMVISLPNDNDLALVLAHELAHNVLGHNQIIKRSHLSTGMASLLTGSGKILREFERSADRYGIFMAARAGFEYKGAAAFWKKLTSLAGMGSWIALTHPDPRNREKNAQIAVDDVTALAASGNPLIP